MRFSKLSWSVVAGVMTLSVFSVAAAARTGSVLGVGPAGLFGSGLFGATTAEVVSPREVQLPPEQQQTLAAQYLLQMDQAATTIRTQLQQARAARDVVKSLCLNDKLNQIDVATRAANERKVTLDAAAKSKDVDRSRHEFTMLLVLHDRSQKLVREASQCVGNEVGFIGESQVSVQIDPTIPTNNPGVLGADPDVLSDPPVVSSPIM